jgi:hypothetical protein
MMEKTMSTHHKAIEERYQDLSGPALLYTIYRYARGLKHEDAVVELHKSLLFRAGRSGLSALRPKVPDKSLTLAQLDYPELDNGQKLRGNSLA